MMGILVAKGLKELNGSFLLLLPKLKLQKNSDQSFFITLFHSKCFDSFNFQQRAKMNFCFAVFKVPLLYKIHRSSK